MGMPSGISLFIISLFMIMPLVMLVNVAISEFKDNINKIQNRLKEVFNKLCELDEIRVNNPTIRFPIEIKSREEYNKISKNSRESLDLNKIYEIMGIKNESDL